MPHWPGTDALHTRLTMSLAAGDIANVTRLDMDVHMGTHVDAPSHFLAGRPTVDSLDLADLIGPALVAEVTADAVTARELAAIAIPAGVTRLLLRTRNSGLWASGRTEFTEGFVALTADAAQWVVDAGIRLIGVDYLSVQRYHDGPATHHILLGAGTVILEGLDLSHANPGVYELLCLPLRLAGAEGAPARAVLRELPTEP